MIRALLVVALLAGQADARMMEHFDLTGLVLLSDSIAIAERTPGKPSHYHVVKVLRGTPTPEIDIDDSLYDFPAHTGTRVYAFLAKDRLVGLRVVADQRVFRFEQWNNPGGWTAVPQGPDPSDAWLAETRQIDAPELERELALAILRVEAFNILVARPNHRDALLSLLPPAGDARAVGGFYRDELAARVEEVLANEGDVEGAVMATTHDHSRVSFGRHLGSAFALASLASDASKPVALRVAAIRAVEEANLFGTDDKAIAKVHALYTDPAPLVRAAAIGTTSQAFDMQSSDAAENRRIAARRAENLKGMTSLAATETSNAVLFSLAAAFARAHRAFPWRTGMPAFAASVSMQSGGFVVDVMCLAGSKAAPSRVTGTHDGQPWTPEAFNITVECGSGLGGGIAKPFAPGAYRLSVELLVGKKPVVVSLGGMTVDASGEVALERQ